MKGECFWNRLLWIILLICFISMSSSLLSFDSLLNCVTASPIRRVIKVSVLCYLYSKRMVTLSPKSWFLVLALQSLHYSSKVKCMARCEGWHMLINTRNRVEFLTWIVLTFGAWKWNSWHLNVNLSPCPNMFTSAWVCVFSQFKRLSDDKLQNTITAPFFVLLVLLSRSYSCPLENTFNAHL